MQLGNFSVSLSVKDIRVSKQFYEKLGFTQIGGDIEQNWAIMKNGTTKIGLFQGMFEKNMLTFNPGWDDEGNQLASFEDVRSIQQRLMDAGVELETTTEVNDDSPAHISLSDPDGNPILIDQHVERPSG